MSKTIIILLVAVLLSGCGTPTVIFYAQNSSIVSAFHQDSEDSDILTDTAAKGDGGLKPNIPMSAVKQPSRTPQHHNPNYKVSPSR